MSTNTTKPDQPLWLPRGFIKLTIHNGRPNGGRAAYIQAREIQEVNECEEGSTVSTGGHAGWTWVRETAEQVFKKITDATR